MPLAFFVSLSLSLCLSLFLSLSLSLDTYIYVYIYIYDMYTNNLMYCVYLAALDFDFLFVISGTCTH